MHVSIVKRFLTQSFEVQMCVNNLFIIANAVTECPETEHPETERPETGHPETEGPETERPKTERLETERPETKCLGD